MSDIFDQAYLAAQKAMEPEQWERISDADRMRAISKQILRLTAERAQSHSLFDDDPPCATSRAYPGEVDFQLDQPPIGPVE